MSGAVLTLLAAGGGESLTVARAGVPLKTVTGYGPAMTPPVVLTPAGGVAPYRCAWNFVSGDTDIICDSPTALGTAWRLNYATPATNASATWKWTVTDAAGQRVFGTATALFIGTA